MNGMIKIYRTKMFNIIRLVSGFRFTYRKEKDTNRNKYFWISYMKSDKFGVIGVADMKIRFWFCKYQWGYSKYVKYD